MLVYDPICNSIQAYVSPPIDFFLTRDCASIMDRVKELQEKLDEAREGKLKELQGKARKHVLESYDRTEAKLRTRLKVFRQVSNPFCSTQQSGQSNESASPLTTAKLLHGFQETPPVQQPVVSSV